MGRQDELAVAAAAVRDLSEGRAVVLTIDGEAGIGKTRLVQSISEDARSRGVAVYYGQAHPFERARPFGVVASALGLVRRSPDPRRAAIGALLGARSDGAPTAGDSQYRVVEEIVDLVETLCADAPAMLVLEDLQWADSASLLAIWTLSRQVQLTPLLMVVTARSSPQPVEVQRLLEDLAAGGARSLTVQPMQPDDVALLATAALGASPGPSLSAMLAKAAGNPFWAMAILRSAADDGTVRREGDRVDVASAEIPSALSDLVVRRLRDLPNATLSLLQVAAVLGDSVSLRDVAAVARQPPAAVVRQLGHAFDAQLLDEADERVVFRHQLVHDAIYHHMPSPARRLLHREVAVVLMATGADRLDVADHLMLGAEPGDDEAVAWLRDAAREASGQSPSVSVELLRRAQALLPSGHPQADLVACEVVQALLRAGQVSEASANARAVLGRQHAAELDIPLRVALLGALALENRADEVITLVRASLSGSAPLSPVDQVMMLAQQSWALTYSGHPQSGETAAFDGLRIAEQAGIPPLAIWALTALFVAVGRQGRFDEALTHARRAIDLAAASDIRALPLQPRFFLGLALFDCDLVDEARTAYREALADEFGSAWWLSETLMADAQVSFVTGAWDDAVPGLVAGFEAAREKGNPLLVSQSLAYRAIIATGRGDARAARELIGPITASLEGSELSYNAGILASAVAKVTAAAGDQQGAYAVLLRCWRIDAARGCRYYYRAVAPDLVRLALALGHRDVAAEVADAVAAAAALAPKVPTVRSLALRCQGQVEGDVQAMLEAVSVGARTPLLLEHASACEDAATMMAARGLRDDAVALWTQALDRYVQVGAEAWAGRVRAELRTLGIRPAPRGPRSRTAGGWDSLTGTERKVSRLVAEGLTNGAVARQLYMSPHTVNTHLRHVFAKLGVSNRVALATVVHHSIE